MKQTATARFGMGCFWHPDDYFAGLNGVISTRVGYAGGSLADPTYEDLGDHTETVEIEFDPSQISYQQLLKHFWSEHDPLAQQKTQYRSVIFVMNDDQRAQALASKRAHQKRLGQPVRTSIEPAGQFYLAEDYHQKYYEKLRARGRL